MHNNIPTKFYFINTFKKNNIDNLDNNTGIIYRNYKDKLKVNEINLLLLLRLIPVVPFFVANILPAIANVSLKNFFWTTFLGIIPGGFVFTLIGANAGSFFDRGEAPDLTVFWSFEFLGPLICLIILVAFPMFFRVARYNHD